MSNYLVTRLQIVAAADVVLSHALLQSMNSDMVLLKPVVIHFFETFASTPNADCVRTFFCCVTQHNYDQIERNREQSLQSAQWVVESMSEFSIDDCEIFPIEGGYIQQCVFRGVYKSTGKKMETHAMIRIHCDNGRVSRIEDYSDPAQGTVPDV